MKAWEITRKDLKLLARDRRTLVVLVALPLIFITIIGMTMGKFLGSNDNNRLTKIVLVDLIDYDAAAADLNKQEFLSDNQTRLLTARNKNIVAELFNRIQAQKGLKIEQIDDVDQARELVSRESIKAALIIGPRFLKKIDALKLTDMLDPARGRLADGLGSMDIEIASNNPESRYHSMIEQRIFGEAMVVSGLYAACNTRLVRPQIKSRCEECEARAVEPPIEFDPPGFDGGEAAERVYQEIIPSYTVLFVFFLVNLMARSFIYERDLGTLRRLRIAPLRPTSLLAGKTMPFLIVSLVQTSILFLSGKFVFDMNWGQQPWLLLPVILTTSLAATSLGLLVATIVRTDSQVSAYGNFVVLVLGAMSGCIMPRDWLPKLMQDISLITPHAWALIAYDQILAKPIPNLTTVAESCGMLTAFSVLFFVFGSLRFSKID